METSHWDTGRLEAFSDGVIAIAATLLILDVNVPLRDFGDLGSGILDQWPAYLAYATSFLTIGGIWMARHALFRRLQYANVRVMRLNLLLLMAVSFLPFPTRLVAETLGLVWVALGVASRRVIAISGVRRVIMRVSGAVLVAFGARLAFNR